MPPGASVAKTMAEMLFGILGGAMSSSSAIAPQGGNGGLRARSGDINGKHHLVRHAGDEAQDCLY